MIGMRTYSWGQSRTSLYAYAAARTHMHAQVRGAFPAIPEDRPSDCVPSPTSRSGTAASAAASAASRPGSTTVNGEMPSGGWWLGEQNNMFEVGWGRSFLMPG